MHSRKVLMATPCRRHTIPKIYEENNDLERYSVTLEHTYTKQD